MLLRYVFKINFFNIHLFLAKSPSVVAMAAVLLSASVERVGVSSMKDFCHYIGLSPNTFTQAKMRKSLKKRHIH